jgi:hypothetical protein
LSHPSVPDDSLERLSAWLLKLSNDGFFGHVTIKFQRGSVACITKEENLRTHELPVGPAFTRNQLGHSRQQ